VREAAARALARFLDRVDGFTRTRLVGEWASSVSWKVRATLASALARGANMIGGRSALEVLARDSYAEVRCASAKALAARMREDPIRFERTLELLANDNRPSVRNAALFGLCRAGRFGLAEQVIGALAVSIEDMDEESAPLALYAIRRAAVHAPEAALRVLEQLANQCDELDDRVVRSLIAQVRVLSHRAPARVRRVLERLQHHHVAWLREEAALVLARLGSVDYVPERRHLGTGNQVGTNSRHAACFVEQQNASP
jgi:HEAT repeat protein